MTELEILQQRFSDMAQQFPGVMHILSVWPKDEEEAELSHKYKPTKDNLLIIWGHGLVGRYVPEINMKHWLVKPRYASWNKDHASEDFRDLAEKAGQVLLEKGLLPRLKLSEYILKLSEYKFINRHVVQLWVLVVHELDNTRRYVSKSSDIKASILHDIIPDKFGKKPPSAYYEVQRDFFFESSSVVSRLWEIEKGHKLKKKSSAANTNEPLSDKALAVLHLLQEQPPYQGLTGPQILKKLDDKKIIISQSALTKSIIPALKPHGVKNKPRIGYYIKNK